MITRADHHRRGRTAYPMLTVAIFVLVAACTESDPTSVAFEDQQPAEAYEGGDSAGDDPQERADVGNEDPAHDDGEGATDSGDTPEEGGTAGKVEVGPEDPAEYIEWLAAKAADATLAVTYEAMGFATDVGGFPYLLTVAQDQPRRMVMIDVELDGWTALHLIPGDGSWVECEADYPLNGWECVRHAVDPGHEDDVWSYAVESALPFAAPIASYSGWTEGSPTTILNRPARCVSPSFELRNDGDPRPVDAEVEICLDELTGVLLRLTTDNIVLAEATEVGPPDPDLFVPPAEPADVEETDSHPGRE